MNLHHLRIFHTVAQRRSITAAAGDLLLSQPAVSLQIKALERELGLPLFERGGARLRLTQAGEMLDRSAASMLHAKDEVERSIAELRDGTRGRLLLGAGATGGMYVLPRILQAYRRLWPDTEIQLHMGSTDHLLDRIVQNALDVVLVGGPIEDRRFEVEPVCADELVLIAAPSHPIASVARVTLREVANVPFIVPEGGSRTRLLVERRFREAGVPLRIAMQLPGTEGVKRGVEAGLGIGMVSGYAIEAECATGVLRRVPIDGWTVLRTMNLVYRGQKYFSPVGERFREFARAFGAEHLLPLPAPRRAGDGARRGRAGGVARRGRPEHRGR